MSSLFSRNAKVEAALMKDETVLFNPANNKFCVLNATAAFIWQSLEQPKTAEQIAAALTSHFANVGMDQAEQDVTRALAELHNIECVVLVV
jgi:hypothetical protein